MREILKVAHLISGGGTTVEAVIQACQCGEIAGIAPVVVIASNSKAKGIEKAAALKIPVIIVQRSQCPDDKAFGERILTILEAYSVDLISQNGWVKRTPNNVIATYRGRIINQHPGALDPGYPDFGGQGMYGGVVTCAAIAYSWTLDKTPETESTLHHVDQEYDHGGLISVVKLSLPTRVRHVTIAELYQDPRDLIEATYETQKLLLPLEHAHVKQVLAAFGKGKLLSYIRPERLIPSANLEVLFDAKALAIGLAKERKL